VNQQAIKKQVNTYFKALTDVKIIMLAILLIFLLYEGAYDSIFKPKLAQLTTLNETSDTRTKELEQKVQGLEHLNQLESTLKDLQTTVIELPQGESPRVVAASESKKVADLANSPVVFTTAPSSPVEPQKESTGSEPNKDKPLNEETLEPEKNKETFNATGINKREVVSFSPKGDSVINILDAKAVAQFKDNGLTTINLLKFDYELKLKGSYAALVDFLNKVVMMKNLVSINHLVFELPKEEATVQPTNPLDKSKANKDESDNSVPVEMTLNFSVYIYDPATSQQSLQGQGQAGQSLPGIPPSMP
jgi:hypothetical protein